MHTHTQTLAALLTRDTSATHAHVPGTHTVQAVNTEAPPTRLGQHRTKKCAAAPSSLGPHTRPLCTHVLTKRDTLTQRHRAHTHKYKCTRRSQGNQTHTPLCRRHACTSPRITLCSTPPPTTHTRAHTHAHTHTLFFLAKKDKAIDYKPRVAPKFRPLAQILMKWTCNILNVAVGSQLQIPLLSINAVAMRGGGRDGGMEEEQKKGGMRASYSQIYQPAFACRKSSSRGLGCC